uniref:Uncharacterized protein n=1 Tax=Triticum urartu TaxID=4572 RepID=A0A8R7R2F4_TRIUA
MQPANLLMTILKHHCTLPPAAATTCTAPPPCGSTRVRHRDGRRRLPRQWAKATACPTLRMNRLFSRSSCSRRQARQEAADLAAPPAWIRLWRTESRRRRTKPMERWSEAASSKAGWRLAGLLEAARGRGALLSRRRRRWQRGSTGRLLPTR